jgi:hypothetical protein
MASASSKSLPFIVLGIAVSLAVYETETGRDVPLEDIITLLTAIGVAGVPLAIGKKVLEVRGMAKTVVEKLKNGDNTPPPS